MTADGQYSIVYQCGELQPDGLCGYFYIDVLSRDTSFPVVLENQMENFRDILCLDNNKLSFVDHKGEIVTKNVNYRLRKDIRTMSKSINWKV